MADDGKRGIIQEYLEGKTQVCAREIWEKALGENVSPRNIRSQRLMILLLKYQDGKN